MVEALLGIQILAVLFAAFMLYIAFMHYKRHNIGKSEFYLWCIIWLAFVYFALWPKILDPLLARLFVTRAMDLLMILAFMILAYLGFTNHVGIKSLQKQIEQLVRGRAIKNARKKQN